MQTVDERRAEIDAGKRAMTRAINASHAGDVESLAAGILYNLDKLGWRLVDTKKELE